MNVFLAGSFDHFHVGHQWLLSQAFSLGDSVHIIVARSSTILKIKGKAPHYNDEQRCARVQQECQYYTKPNTVELGREAADFEAVLRSVAPDVLLLGYDQRFAPPAWFMGKVVRCAPYNEKVFKSSYFRYPVGDA